MAALPVDMSKTEPKPAYYKLQFGDDYTGFSYYVRTLGIVIGRKCVRLYLGEEMLHLKVMFELIEPGKAHSGASPGYHLAAGSRETTT